MSAFRYVFTKFCHRLPAGLDPPCWCADVRGRIVFPSSPLDVVESISAVGLPSGLGQEVPRFSALGVYCHLVLIASEGWEVWGWGGWKGVGGGVHFDAVSSAHRPCVTSRNAQQSWWRSGCPPSCPHDRRLSFPKDTRHGIFSLEGSSSPSFYSLFPSLVSPNILASSHVGGCECGKSGVTWRSGDFGAESHLPVPPLPSTLHYTNVLLKTN